MLICTVCGSAIPDAVEKCFTCGFNAGPPNVRAAQAIEEVTVLRERYQAAIDRAGAAGSLGIVQQFESAVSNSLAVINVDLNFLHHFVTSNVVLYANYEGAVAGRIRKPAETANDLKRRGVAGTLFGGYADEITYAALSLDGLAPVSYGHYGIQLRDVAVKNRATVLENNSYEFVKKNSLGPGDPRPRGFIATWENRSRLAVAKLGDYITPLTKVEDFPRLLLTSSGDRSTDEFIEVHLYGTFDLSAVECVKGTSSGLSRDDRDLLRIVKTHLGKAGTPWIEQ